LYSKLFEKKFLKEIKQILFFSGGNSFAHLIQIVYAILVARSITPYQLGIYSGLYANIGISITLVNFGLDIWMLQKTQQHISLRELTGRVLSIKLLFGLIWGVLCLLLLPIFRPNVFTFFLVLIAIGDVFFESLITTILSAWNIQGKIKIINIFLLVFRFGKLLFLLVLLFYLNNISHVAIIGSRLFISLLGLVTSSILFSPIFKGVKIRTMFQMIKESLDFGFSEILAVIYGNIDLAILAFYSISDTGFYSPASGIIHALFIIPNSFYLFLLPRIAKKRSQLSKKGFKQLIFKIVLLFSVVGIILSLALLIGGEFAVNLVLGPRYLFTGDLLTLLSPVIFIKSVSFSFALIIIINGDQRKRLLPQFLVATINITLLILFIPIYGVIGVAWIYIASEMILLIGYGIIVIKSVYKTRK